MSYRIGAYDPKLLSYLWILDNLIIGTINVDKAEQRIKDYAHLEKYETCAAYKKAIDEFKDI